MYRGKTGPDCSTVGQTALQWARLLYWPDCSTGQTALLAIDPALLAIDPALLAIDPALLAHSPSPALLALAPALLAPAPALLAPVTPCGSSYTLRVQLHLVQPCYT